MKPLIIKKTDPTKDQLNTTSKTKNTEDKMKKKRKDDIDHQITKKRTMLNTSAQATNNKTISENKMSNKTKDEKNSDQQKRSISSTRMQKLQDDLKTKKENVLSLEDLIETLDKNIKDKQIFKEETDSTGKTTSIATKLSTAEIRGLRLERDKLKLELRKVKPQLKMAEKDFSEACEHNAEIIRYKSKKFSKKVEAQHLARKQENERQERVESIISNLLKTGDPRMSNLTESLSDSVKFRKNMDEIISKEDYDTFTTISGLSSVKTGIYNGIKDLLLDSPDEEDDSNI